MTPGFAVQDPTAAKPRRHALAGQGPIVDRARHALRHVAAQFGAITGSTQTSVSVRTHDGIDLTLSYDSGNYIFSRVYNLTIAVDLPAGSTVPAAATLSHRERSGPRYVGAGGDSQGMHRLNESAAGHLRRIDLHSSTITTRSEVRVLTVTPLGGSFVWVLIPPVFKATAFPQGETERILGLVRAIRGVGSSSCGNAASPGTPGSP